MRLLFDSIALTASCYSYHRLGANEAAAQADPVYVVYSVGASPDCTGVCTEFYEQSTVCQHYRSISDWFCNDPHCRQLFKGC